MNVQLQHSVKLCNGSSLRHCITDKTCVKPSRPCSCYSLWVDRSDSPLTVAVCVFFLGVASLNGQLADYFQDSITIFYEQLADYFQDSITIFYEQLADYFQDSITIFHGQRADYFQDIIPIFYLFVCLFHCLTSS